MYSLNEKENAIELMKKGTGIEEIILTTGISKSTILKWKKEIKLRKYIKQLIESGKLEEAKEEVEKITGKVNEPLRNSILIRIAREEGDRETEKRLLDRQLEIDPDNVTAMIGRIIIAREERKRNIDTEINIDIERKLLDRQLELEPNNIKAISSRIAIARGKGDTETRKRLLDRLLELEPNNVKTISNRIRIAIKERDIKTEKTLLDRLLEIEPNNKKAIKRRRTLAIKENDKELQEQLIKKLAEIRLTEDRELEDLLSQQYISQEETDSQEENTSSIKWVRKLIYESSDIMQASEQIKELLEEQNELEREVALAELFTKTGLQTRAEKSLKRYRRKIENLPERQEDLRTVKKALELVRNTKTRKLQWDELWKTLESSQITIQEKEELDER